MIYVCAKPYITQCVTSFKRLRKFQYIQQRQGRFFFKKKGVTKALRVHVWYDKLIELPFYFLYPKSVPMSL
jgi:hypothetical protein